MSRHGRTNSRTTEVHDIKMFLSILNRLDFVGDREAPAVEFLTHGHRASVLEVGAAHLQHVLEFVSLLVVGLNELLQGLQEVFRAVVHREVQSGRVRIVRGLTEVRVVVRRHLLLGALRETQLLAGDAADHFVRIHVGRSNVRRDRAEFLVRTGSRLLHLSESLDEVLIFIHRVLSDVEVFLAAQGLNAVVHVIRNLEIAKEIMLNTGH